jgi:hypothetical protein
VNPKFAWAYRNLSGALHSKGDLNGAIVAVRVYGDDAVRHIAAARRRVDGQSIVADAGLAVDQGHRRALTGGSATITYSVINRAVPSSRQLLSSVPLLEPTSVSIAPLSEQAGRAKSDS